MKDAQWGDRAWQEAHFPAAQLDGEGDTWGIRWRGLEKLRHASYLRLLRAILRQPQPLDVLDIGCALCDFTNKAAALNPANRFWVTDTADNAISWVRRRFPAFHSAVAALPDIPFDVQFDVVLCLEVLCYLDSADRCLALRRIRERLKPSGVLLFSGVVDGGERYHTRAEVLGTIGSIFVLERVVYNHWALYRRCIERPLEKARTALCSRAAASPRARPRRLLAAAAGGARALVASRLLAEAAQALSRPLRSAADASEIVVLARKATC